VTTENEYLIAATAMAVVQAYSQTVRDDLLSSPKFIARFAVATDATVTLGGSGLSFQRSDLFAAIRKVLERKSPAVVASAAGEDWTVTFAGGTPPNVALVFGRERLIFAPFALLSVKPEDRLNAFSAIAEQNHLSEAVRQKWQAILAERTPNDDELTGLHEDLRNTPIAAANAVRESLQGGGLSLDILVPRNEAYYQQLVGEPGNAQTLADFIAAMGTPFIAGLLADGGRRSLSLAWLLCSHSTIAPLIDANWKGDEDVLGKAFSWLAKHGDPISQTGAIEVGLLRAASSPALAVPLTELIEAVLNGPPDSGIDAFELLSALQVAVCGQMARCRVLISWPPFARRMAALAQAGLVLRQLIELIADSTDLVQWLRGSSEQYFVLQCLVDMRLEPRWFPELASAAQWRNELLGRVWFAAVPAAEPVSSLGLQDRLLGDGPEALPSQINRMKALFPGPLEGGGQALRELTSEIATAVRDRLTGASVHTGSFSALINASMWMRIPEEVLDLAAEAVERSHFQIPVGESDIPLSLCLLGLASTAAVSRSEKLSTSVLTVVRLARRLNPDQLSVDEAFRIGMLACAAHVELNNWSEQVGQLMTEFAFQDLTSKEADDLHSHLAILCHLVPELWGTCGQADAALASVVR
jgi:hypothetical protein